MVLLSKMFLPQSRWQEDTYHRDQIHLNKLVECSGEAAEKELTDVLQSFLWSSLFKCARIIKVDEWEEAKEVLG